MPRDRKSIIGRHRADASSGWQRANPTGQRNGPTIGSNRGSSGWQRANPTGSRGGPPLGSHRTPVASSAPSIYDDDVAPTPYTPLDGLYNNDDVAPLPYVDILPGLEDEAPETYTTPLDGLYNNEDDLPEHETYTTSIDGLYNNEDDAPEHETYTTSIDGLYNNEDDAPLPYVDMLPGLEDETSEHELSEGGSYTSSIDGLSSHDAAPSAVVPPAPRRDAGLRRKQRLDHYDGEERSVAWRMPPIEQFAARRNLDPASPEALQKFEAFKNSTRVTTDYHTTDEQRQQTRLKESPDGRVAATHQRSDGRTYTTRDTENVGWVMDPATANIHTFDPLRQVVNGNGHKVNTHHTTPLAGGDVAGAGTMDLVDGHIRTITDQSGHYRPEAEYTHQSVEQMAQRGILDRDASADEQEEHGSGPGNLSARVELSGYVEDDPRQGKRWLQDQDYHQGPLTLPYQAFLQTQGNEVQARKKVSMQEELLSKVSRAKRNKPSGRQDRGDDTVLEPALEPAPVDAPPFAGGYTPDDVVAAMLADDDLSDDDLSDDEDWEHESDEVGEADDGIRSYTLDPTDPERRIWDR